MTLRPKTALLNFRKSLMFVLKRMTHVLPHTHMIHTNAGTPINTYTVTHTDAYTHTHTHQHTHTYTHTDENSNAYRNTNTYLYDRIRSPKTFSNKHTNKAYDIHLKLLHCYPITIVTCYTGQLLWNLFIFVVFDYQFYIAAYVSKNLGNNKKIQIRHS